MSLYRLHTSAQGPTRALEPGRYILVDDETGLPRYLLDVRRPVAPRELLTACRAGRGPRPFGSADALDLLEDRGVVVRELFSPGPPLPRGVQLRAL